MATALISPWNTAWHAWWNKRDGRSSRNCAHFQGFWRLIRGKRPGVVLDGVRYCVDGCLESALAMTLTRLQTVSLHKTPHRIPLGLLLLSRHLINAEQLRSALQAQRSGGYGRIGEWLQNLGLVSEQQVTSALARQWSCPVLRQNVLRHRSEGARQLPLTILERFMMCEVDHVPSSAKLYIAFAEGIDYSILYAIEQMTGCHTEYCMATPSLVRGRLQELASHRNENESLFEQVSDHSEASRIIRSYCVRLGASEIRLVSCGAYFWARLLSPDRCAYDLLIRSPETQCSHFAPSTNVPLVN